MKIWMRKTTKPIPLPKFSNPSSSASSTLSPPASPNSSKSIDKFPFTKKTNPKNSSQDPKNASPEDPSKPPTPPTNTPTASGSSPPKETKMERSKDKLNSSIMISQSLSALSKTGKGKVDESSIKLGSGSSVASRMMSLMECARFILPQVPSLKHTGMKGSYCQEEKSSTKMEIYT